MREIVEDLQDAFLEFDAVATARGRTRTDTPTLRPRERPEWHHDG
ncbi:hypothetical protein [Pseudonocardia sp.]|nr:hypothetical protein [Pseudonocardia sp.]